MLSDNGTLPGLAYDCAQSHEVFEVLDGTHDTGHCTPQRHDP